MARVITHISAVIVGCVTVVMLLALGVGRVLPRGDEMIFSSVTRWQSGVFRLFMLDVERGVAQHFITNRTVSMPPRPVVWSPNGEHLAYITELTGTSYSEDRLAAYIVDAQGRNRYRLITDADSDAYNTIYDVVWSPNGERLAFIGGRSGEEDVYLADADGRNPRNLTRRGIGYKNLVWSADSRYLTVENSHLNEDIYRLNPDTGAVKNLTAHAGRDIRAFWSPDGEQMAFLSTRHGDTLSSAQFDLYLVNADGRNLRRLTDDFPASSMWVARWSPDGRKIAFGSWSWSGGADIYLIDVNSRMVRNFTSDSDTESAPVWSPDGRWLAYEARASGSNWVINLVNADGENRRQLTSEAYTNRRPVWSPDGQTLLFHSNRNRSWSIYLLSDLSSEQPLMRRLTGGRGIDFWPVWRP